MKPDRSDLVGFFVIAFGASWLCWIPAGLSPHGLTSAPVRWLTYAGSAGPAIAGIFLTYRSPCREERDEYWARLTQWSRLRVRSLLPMLLLYPLITVFALLLSSASPGGAPDLQIARRLVAQPWLLASFALSVLLLGPLPEELGWRGYALDRLQRNRSALAASLILGLLWALWHLPLFFIAGSYQHDLGFGSIMFWSYEATVVALAVLFTWVHNHNARSILAAIMFHFALNFTGSLVRLSPLGETLRMILVAVAGGCIVWLWASRTLGLVRTSSRFEP